MHCGILRAMGRKPKEPVRQTLVGQNLERLLVKHGLTQAEAARKTGGAVTQGEISRIIRGQTVEPAGSKVFALAVGIGEPMEAFYADPKNPGAPEPSLQAFRESDFGRDVTQDELVLLASTRWPIGEHIPPRAWDHVLQAIRLMRAGADR